MKQIRLAKWRIYLLFFSALWSGAVAIDLVHAELAAGHKVWPVLLDNAMVAALVALLSFCIGKDEE